MRHLIFCVIQLHVGVRQTWIYCWQLVSNNNISMLHWQSKFDLCLIKSLTYMGRYTSMHSWPALCGGELSASHPGCFTPGQRAIGTHWIEKSGWILVTFWTHIGRENLLLPLGIEPWFFKRPVHSLVIIPTELFQLLYCIEAFFFCLSKYKPY